MYRLAPDPPTPDPRLTWRGLLLACLAGAVMLGGPWLLLDALWRVAGGG